MVPEAHIQSTIIIVHTFALLQPQPPGGLHFSWFPIFLLLLSPIPPSSSSMTNLSWPFPPLSPLSLVWMSQLPKKYKRKNVLPLSGTSDISTPSSWSSIWIWTATTTAPLISLCVFVFLVILALPPGMIHRFTKRP